MGNAKKVSMFERDRASMYQQIRKALAKKDTIQYMIGVSGTTKMQMQCYIPPSLLEHIHLLPICPAGAFLINCEGVKHGLFGKLEVLAKTVQHFF